MPFFAFPSGPRKQRMSVKTSSEAVRKTVVVVDLSRYSDIGKELEQHSGPAAVRELNAQIHGLIRSALETAGVAAEPLPYKNTGDGAIIALDGAEPASRFAEALHLAARAHNLKKDVPLAQRHFRVGVWTDTIVLDREATPAGRIVVFELAGTAVANAVRLEGACRTGEVLISPDTWADLPGDMRRLYGDQEEVKGKRGERFRAHRRKVVDPAPWDEPGKTDAVPPPAAPPQPAPPRTNVHYSGKVKNAVCDRLILDWERLADYFNVPLGDRDGFKPGRKPHGVWEWLEQRGRLGELEAGLTEVGRADLIAELRDRP